MTHIVVLGDLNLDILARIPATLPSGGEAREFVTVEPGGSAGTFARTAASAGARVTFIGAIGSDAGGDLLERSLSDLGVIPRLRRASGASGAVLAIERGYERSMVCSRGANDHLTEAWVLESWPEDCTHLHVSGYALLSETQRHAAIRAFSLASEHAMSISVDPPPATLLQAYGEDAFATLLPSRTWLFPNLSEGETLTGRSRPEEIVDALSTRYPVGALTLGPEGATAWDQDEHHHSRPDGVDAVNTTGAGDVYAATFVTHFLRTRNVAEANKKACHAASAMLRARRRPVS